MKVKKDHIIIVLTGLSFMLLALTITAWMPGEQEQTAENETIEKQKPEKHLPYWPDVPVPKKMEFCGEPVPLEETEIFERMDREIQTNTFFHSHTIQIIKRADKYFPRIEEILREEGVPEDFKYLAVAESGLENVVSPAKAVGFWQFIATTARDYGLEVRDEVDERYDWEKSTYAACRYLKDAYAKFGSWTDVAVSYNMGMTGMQRARDAQRLDSYYDLKLTWEPTRYVFRIIALKAILTNPEAYHFNIHPDNRYRLDEVEYVAVSETIPDLITFALSQGISYKSLRYYNPWLREKSLTIKPGKTYRIAIPTEKRNKLR